MDLINENMLEKGSQNTSEFISDRLDSITYGFTDMSVESNTNHLNDEKTECVTSNHTPTPIVSRSFLNDANKDHWKNVSAYSYCRSNNDESKNNTTFSQSKTSIGVYNSVIDNKSSFTQNWITCQNSMNYSPEMKRNTEVIFEEKIQNENDDELENSDYSDRSVSPDNSTSSHDSSSSSSNSLSETSGAKENIEPSLDNSQHTVTYQTRPVDSIQPIDFQPFFCDTSEDEMMDKRYHQPPKAIDREAAKRLARRLYECDGFKITDVAKHLSKKNDFSQIVGEEFANYFDFSNLRLDKALRLFLSRFTLTGETPERERIMHHFSKRFIACNSQLYNGEDACHTLVCALIILNTNLHSQTVPKMTCIDFITNLKDLNDGENFPSDNLKELFDAISQEPIRWPMDDELVGIVNMPKSDIMDLSKQMMNNQMYSVGLDQPRDSNCREFMNGYVVRKWLKEPGGRKTSFGKRGWKLFYGRLRDITIYLYKDHDRSCNNTNNGTNNINNNQTKISPRQSETMKSIKSKYNKQKSNADPGKNQTSLPNPNNSVATSTASDSNQSTDKTSQPTDNENQINDTNENATMKETKPTSNDNDTQLPDPLNNNTMHTESLTLKSPYNLVLPPADSEIHINHAYASKAIDYIKKRNVFRIKTKYGSEYLFQVNNEKEMENWVDNINYAAALLSDPEPIIGITTMEKLNSKSIPKPRITPLSMRDQLESHQKCVLELEKIICNLKENPPKKSERKLRSEFDESIRFREQELLRYKTYSQLLEYEMMKSLAYCRVPTTDAPFFYPMPLSSQPLMAAGSYNQAFFLNPQVLNGLTTSDAYNMSNPVFFSQPGMRFRPSLAQNSLVAMPNNRRIRYRAPTLIPQGFPNPTVAPSSSTDSTSPAAEEPPSDVAMYSQCATNTFYEIV